MQGLGESLRIVASKLGHGVYGLIIAALAVLIGAAFGMLLRRLVKRALTRMNHVPDSIADLAGKSIYYLVVATAGILGLAVAGIDVTGFAFAGSLLGVALGFAAQTVASNFFSGFFLYIDKPLEQGDLVELSNGIIGRVRDITMFSTRIETLDGTIVRIPNEDVFKAMITNYQKSTAVRISYAVSISYSSDIEAAKKAILRVLEDDPYVLAEPEPIIYVEDLGDSAVVLRVLFWVPSKHMIETRRRLLARIKKALDEAGIEIPFPQRVVWLRMEAGSGGAEAGGVEEALRGITGGPRRAPEEMGLSEA